MVGFRLSATEFEALVAFATATGTSPGETAKGIVLNALKGGVQPSAQTNDVKSLRGDIAVLLESLLLITKTLPPPEAKRFVKEKL